MLFKYKILILLSLLIIAAVFPLYNIVYKPNLLSSEGHFGKIVIDPGDTLIKIAGGLENAGLVDDAGRFIWAAKIMRVETRIPAGIFTIPFGLSNRDLILRMMFSGTNTENVTIKEGWAAKKIAMVLQKECDIDSAGFMNAVLDSVFTHELGIEAPTLEGYLYPNTYNLYLGMNPYETARKMVTEFKSIFADSLKSRAFDIGFSVNEIITLASIIEGEIIYSSEAPVVSAVYHNRLKKGMRLQADPTIQYIIPDGPRRVLYRDLKIDSPYNTYRIKGLPPGPIGNPGKRAIFAALYPKKVPYIYFVARGDGYHNFNTTIEGHLADKRKFDNYRRKIARQKKKS
ncbi:MAG: endolytic transglycosylase MltG [FCB group bacterium]|nr:endolytic transglycosylase MltG [FCB group bacterium]